MAVKYFKGPLTVPTFSIRRPSKIYPNLDFWFEDIPSGSPAGKWHKNDFLFLSFRPLAFNICSVNCVMA
jgi:hypothetical protein